MKNLRLASRVILLLFILVASLPERADDKVSFASICDSMGGSEAAWGKFFEGKANSFVPSKAETSHLAALLDDSAPNWRNRNGDEIERMKTSILILLARAPDVDDAALIPRLREILTYSSNTRLYAAAARVAAAHPVPAAASLRSPLFRALQRNWGSDDISFAAYFQCCVTENATSARTEALNALLALDGQNPETRAAIEAIRKEDDTESRTAIVRRLTRPTVHTETAIGDVLPINQRTQIVSDVIPVSNSGSSRSSAANSGLPGILTFVFTRCHNPLKCSLTATQLGRLQKQLRTAGLDQKVRILAGSYDPENDSRTLLENYFRQRGCEVATMHFIEPSIDSTKKLLAQLGALVSYNGSDVASHGVEFFLLDSQNRLAATFNRGLWKPENFITALESLLKEN